MENKKKKSTGLLLSILGVISLVLITAGVTYAFFSYAKQGVTPNTISTGTITFRYDEDSTTGLTINDALPKSDSVGIGENAATNGAFEFSVTSTTPSTAYINYIVTARMDENSTLPQNQVKLYLTTTSTNTEGTGGSTDAGWVANGTTMGSTAGSILKFSELPDVNANNSVYSSILAPSTNANGVVERVIYKGQVPASSRVNGNTDDTYTRNFKLNMWLVGPETTAAYCTDDNNNDAVVTTIGGDPADDTNCVAPNYTWHPATTSSNGMADYSAFEFVKLTALGTPTTAASCSDNNYTTKSACEGANETWTPAVYSTTPIDVDDLTEGTNWLRSVAYYNGIEGGTLNADEWTRLKYVNQTDGEVVTVAQGGNQPAGANWAASEQYYPLNGQTFTVTINVYAEGATTYTVGS